MKDIKFRVWNPRYKDFSYWGFEREGTFTGIPTGAGLNIKECSENSQQFTGLKDRKGKEIYEGDILIADDTLSAIFIVEYQNGSFLLVNIKKQPLCATIAWDGWKIIGNIYENPELIKTLDSVKR